VRAQFDKFATCDSLPEFFGRSVWPIAPVQPQLEVLRAASPPPQ
jgi:hypothetical protein